MNNPKQMLLLKKSEREKKTYTHCFRKRYLLNMLAFWETVKLGKLDIFEQRSTKQFHSPEVIMTSSC